MPEKPEPSSPGREPRPGLADALRDATWALHVDAERSGIVREILKGRATLPGYALLLRNLLPAYETMEAGLDRWRNAPGLRALARAELYRADAIAADLEALCGSGWRRQVPLLPAADRYARRIGEAAHDGPLLIAHAYTRYLGDLNGGQALSRLLRRSLGLTDAGLSFYAFPRIGDLDAFKAAYRQALDRAGSEIGDVSGVVREGTVAFRHNIAVSEEVLAAAQPREAAVART